MRKKVIKNKIFWIFVLLVLSISFSVSILGKIISKKMSLHVFNEVNKNSKILIRDVLDEEFINSLNLDSLIIASKNSAGEIELINYDIKKVNIILGKINDEVVKIFNEFNAGKSPNDYYSSSLFKKNNNYVMMSVPLGIIVSNPLFMNIGPRIPIKLKFLGQVETDIILDVKQYGINSIMVKLSVNIKVSEVVFFPFYRQNVMVEMLMPLAIQIISGKVPENYLNSEKFDIIE